MADEVKKEGVWAAIAELVRNSTPDDWVNGFRTLFRAFLATIMVIGGGSFLWIAAFTEKAELNEHTGVIVGFVTGTLITAAIMFYFGGQDKSKKDDSDSSSVS